MSTSPRSDPSKDKCLKLANQFKDAKNSFKIVIVRDMWLTGFEVPCEERQKDEV